MDHTFHHLHNVLYSRTIMSLRMFTASSLQCFRCNSVFIIYLPILCNSFLHCTALRMFPYRQILELKLLYEDFSFACRYLDSLFEKCWSLLDHYLHHVVIRIFPLQRMVLYRFLDQDLTTEQCSQLHFDGDQKFTKGLGDLSLTPYLFHSQAGISQRVPYLCLFYCDQYFCMFVRGNKYLPVRELY